MEVNQDPPFVFQCWSCKQKGNAYTLLRKWFDDLPNLSPKERMDLSKLKQEISPRIIKQVGIKKDPTYGNPVFPIYSVEGKLVSCYKYNQKENIWFSSPKPLSHTLIGCESLASTGTVFIPEGHWDYLAALSNGFTDKELLGCCGSSFPMKRLDLLSGRHVVWMGDNDKAGKEGLDRLARDMVRSGNQASILEYLDWTKITLPVSDKDDFRDLVRLTKGT